MARHVRAVTDFELAARESDEEAAHRAEGLVVALLTILMMGAGVFAVVLS
jgi:hypothetical protein